MSGLFNEKGKPIKVADSEAANQAVLSGHAFARDDTNVPVYNPEGKLVDIAGKDLHTAIAGGGYKIATEQQVRRADLESKLGAPGTALGLLNQYVAKDAALGRGATGPVTDALVTEVADLFGKKEQAKEYLRDLKEAYPLTSTSNEVAGMLATILAGGAGGGAAKVGTMAPRIARGAALAGEGLEAARLLGAGVEASRLAEGGAQAARLGGELPQATRLLGQGARAIEVNATPRALGGGARTIGGTPVIEGVLEDIPRAASAAEEMRGSVLPATGLGAPPPPVVPGVAPGVGIPGNVIARAAMPASAIDMIGGAAEKGARSLLGDGLGSRIASKAVRGGVENAFYEAGSKMDESVLGEDKDMTAEKLLLATGHGALLGAALGGGAGIAGEVMGAARKLAANKLGSAARGMLIDALNPTAKMRQKIAKLGEEDFARVALELTEAGGKTSDMAPKAREAMEAVREELIKLHANSPSAGPAFSDVMKTIRGAMEGKGGTEEYRALRELLIQGEHLSGQRAKVGRLLEDMAANDPKTMSEWWGWQQRFSQEAKFDAKNSPASAQAFRDIRSIVQDAMFEAGDKAASKSSDRLWSEQVKDANKRFQHLKLLTELTERQATQSNKFSFVEKFLIPMAFWSTGPLGLAKGMAASVVINQGRQRAAGMAHILDKMSGLGALKKTVANVDHAVDNSVVAFFANTKPTAKFRVYELPDEKGTTKEKYMRRIGALDRVQASPQAMQDGLSRTFGGIGRTAPDTNAALTAASLRAVDYLRRSAPPVGFSQLGVRQPVTEADMRQFNRKWEAVDDPIGTVLGGLASGRISPDHVEAMKETYPKWYQEDLRPRILATVAEQQAEGKKLPKQKLVQLSILFDAKLDPSLDLTQSLQQQLKPQEPTGKRKGGSGGGIHTGKLPSFSEMYATDSQRRQMARR